MKNFVSALSKKQVKRGWIKYGPNWVFELLDLLKLLNGLKLPNRLKFLKLLDWLNVLKLLNWLNMLKGSLGNLSSWVGLGGSGGLDGQGSPSPFCSSSIT